MDRARQARARLDALRHDYRERTAELIRSLAERLRCEPTHPGALGDAEAQLHKLSGSGGSFGYPELSRRARAVELTVRLMHAAPPAPAQFAILADAIAALAALLDEVPPAPAETSTTSPDKLTGSILLLEPDQPEASRIADTLRQFGHTVHVCNTPAEAALLLSSVRPDAMLVDLDLALALALDADADADADADDLAMLLAAITDLRTAFELHDAALYCIARDQSMRMRLAAARAGASAYFVKPVDPMRVIDRLELLRQSRNAPRYRVMLIDDDGLLVSHYAAVLEAAGFDVCTVEDPFLALDAIAGFNPDLILLDLYMPGCSGPELARVIRMREDWLALPIVFLSAETDLSLQISAASEGADDFLTKPITDAQLIAAVRTRCDRSHAMSILINRDSLTGLLKHARIKEEVQSELARATRADEPLVVAMLDIDHFKRVNDTYGHPVGDQVIRALANLLRQRVRASDRVGRYGGEEFMLVLGNCTQEAAVKLLVDICARFAALRFRTQLGEFSVTLSAGVASSEQFRDPHALSTAADRALYLAKRTGRDRVETAPII